MIRITPIVNIIILDGVANLRFEFFAFALYFPLQLIFESGSIDKGSINHSLNNGRASCSLSSMYIYCRFEPRKLAFDDNGCLLSIFHRNC